MKSKKTKTPKQSLIISAAAAARLFLRIASLEIKLEFKDQLLTVVAKIISGQPGVSRADFFFKEEKEILAELDKAIERSAKARAAAARRRAARAAAPPSHEPSADSQSETASMPPDETQPPLSVEGVEKFEVGTFETGFAKGDGVVVVSEIDARMLGEPLRRQRR